VNIEADAFFNIMDRKLSAEIGPPFFPANFIIPLRNSRIAGVPGNGDIVFLQ
jgi:hypothetical protein